MSLQRKSHPETEKPINSPETQPGSRVGPGPEAGASPSSRDVVPAHSQAAWKAGEEPREAFLMPPKEGKVRHNRGMGVGLWPLSPSSTRDAVLRRGWPDPPGPPRRTPERREVPWSTRSSKAEPENLALLLPARGAPAPAALPALL